jgi:hypothetical protein
LACKPANKTLNNILSERGYQELNTFDAMFDENSLDGHVGTNYFLKRFDKYAIKIGTNGFLDDDPEFVEDIGWIIYYFNGDREWGTTKSFIVRWNKEGFLNTIENQARLGTEEKMKRI